MNPYAAPTRVAVLTPHGRAAVAVIAVTGPEAVRLVERFFQPVSGRKLAEVPLNTISFGRWDGSDGEEVVVIRRAADEVEVHCHGGIAASAAIVRALEITGCEEVSWQQHSGSLHEEPLTAAARIALADAVTARTAGILLDQYRGALRRAFDEIGQLARSTRVVEREAAAKQIDQLLGRADLGRHLTRPFRVVVAGEPNVGKSSLINALAGYQRAIVFETPGTTRDVVTVLTAFDGWPVELSDTAGMRETRDELEAAGIREAIARAEMADLVVLVLDGTRPLCSDMQSLRTQFPQALIVVNKSDLMRPAAMQTSDLCVSALTGCGLVSLQQQIACRLVPEVPPPGAAVPFTDEQLLHLQNMQALLAAPLRGT